MALLNLHYSELYGYFLIVSSPVIAEGSLLGVALANQGLWGAYTGIIEAKLQGEKKKASVFLRSFYNTFMALHAARTAPGPATAVPFPRLLVPKKGCYAKQGAGLSIVYIGTASTL